MTEWIVENLGPDIPHHFTAFHPDWKMRNVSSTPPETLTRARKIAMDSGIRYVYTGNVHDAIGGSTYCHSCGELLIERNWYKLGEWNLDGQGCCKRCGQLAAGRFEALPGTWGAKRQPVRFTA